jgi:hypothetical protein
VTGIGRRPSTGRATLSPFAAEIRRRQQLGTLASMDSGRVTLAEYVIETWAAAYGSNLARKTQLHYQQLLVKHVLPELGPLELRAVTPETIARWQADRLAEGHGRVAIRHAFDLLGSILQRALEGPACSAGRIATDSRCSSSSRVSCAASRSDRASTRCSTGSTGSGAAKLGSLRRPRICATSVVDRRGRLRPR